MFDIETNLSNIETTPAEPLGAERESVVVFDQVTVTYKVGANGRSLSPLRGISLTINKGEFVALLGPSGCGKTTLLRAASGLVHPTKGDVRVLGQPPDIARRERNIGYVFQDPVLLPWRTVRSNIELPREVTHKQWRRDIEWLLRLVKLQDFSDALPAQLSGGMRSRTSIARALSAEPEVLLMDEPFASLDALTRDQMQEDLQGIVCSTGVSVLFVTHSIEEALFLADRVVILGAPGSAVLTEVAVPFPRPRSHEFKYTLDFQSLVLACRQALTSNV